MPPLREILPPTLRVARPIIRYQPILQSLRGLHFHHGRTRPVFKAVPTLVNPEGDQRFPCVEAILGTRGSVHDCVVNVINDQGEELKYLVSTQRGPYLARNRAVEVLSPGTNWNGSLLVMKMGSRCSFIRLSSSDKELAITAVLRFIECCDGDVYPTYLDIVPV